MEQLDLLDKGDITTADLDHVVSLYYDARNEYESKKEQSSLAHAKYEALEEKLITMLESADKEDYSVKGIGKVRIGHKLSVRVPDTAESKAKFFAWVEAKYGDEGLAKYRTVNSNSLNSLYNSELELAKENGGEWNGIDGIGEPNSRTNLTFTRSKGNK